MLEKLKLIYGEEDGQAVFQELQSILTEAKTKIKFENRSFWSEKDIALITYPDSVSESNNKSLKSLQKFLSFQLNGELQIVHILPFFPYSSDRGFSISDFYQVKKEFGSWKDLEEISKKFRVMADLVLNHVSVQHEWFQKFLAGDPEYEDYFIWFEEGKIPYEELKKVHRPRATPLLTPFQTAKGKRWIWTTFSVEDFTDQVDLNFKNPRVLLEIVKIVFFLLEKGVSIFRLDAAPYIWKELGTSCENLPQAHTIVAVLRNILDEVNPSALLVSQSSVKLEDNLVYFGKKGKEANIIYNFSLPLLVLNAFHSQNNGHLKEMAVKMKTPDSAGTFLNILAVHDGIGVAGAKGFLSDQEFKSLYLMVEERGGKLGYFNLPDGTKSVRELNITWWSALLDSGDPFELALQKFVTSYAIAFALKGLPAVYYLSLIGQENDLELFRSTGVKRDLNRTNLDLTQLEGKLKQADAKEAQVFRAMTELIKKRKAVQAFHPNAKQEVLELDEKVFAVLRGEGSESVLALHNLSKDQIKIRYQGREFTLGPYEYEWVKLNDKLQISN